MAEFKNIARCGGCLHVFKGSNRSRHEFEGFAAMNTTQDFCNYEPIVRTNGIREST